MSQVSNVITACPTIQAKLNEEFAKATSLSADEKMPFAEFLFSPANTTGISGTISPGGGKVKTYQLTYWQRLLESSLLSNQANPNCTSGDTPEDNQATYTLDTSVNLQTPGVTLTSTDLEAVCDPNSAIFAQLILREMDVLRRGVATRVSQQGAALYGTYGADGGYFTAGNSVGNVNTSDELVIATLESGGTAPNKFYHAILRAALDDIGMPDNVAIFGGTVLRSAYMAALAGCCTSAGLDIGTLFAQYGYAFAYDKRLETALASVNKGLVLAPGALQVLQHVRAPWRDGMPGDVQAGSDYVHKALVDPQLGAVYDFSLKDDCGSISFNLTWTGKVIGMPNDMFNASDINTGITYVNKVLVTNP